MPAMAASRSRNRFTSPAQEFAPWIHALIFVLTRVLPTGQYGQIMGRVLLTAASFQDAPGGITISRASIESEALCH
jgi:hypothetical protein